MITESFFKDAIKVCKRRIDERYTIASDDGEMRTLEGNVRYKKGFYIITGSRGEGYPMTPEKFRELKDDYGNGRCSPKMIIKYAKLADHDGDVRTSWGEKLYYRNKEDYIVRHGNGDYGLVKRSIFEDTYQNC